MEKSSSKEHLLGDHRDDYEEPIPDHRRRNHKILYAFVAGCILVVLTAFVVINSATTKHILRLPSLSESGGPVRYLFVFGDSYTSTEFQIDGPRPSPANRKSVESSNVAIGNPSFPGRTTSGGANWVGHLTNMSSTPPMVYNFAVPGAAVDSRLTPTPDVEYDFVALAALFMGALPPHGVMPWDSDNTAVVIWFGQNDLRLSWDHESFTSPIASKFDRIFKSYFDQIDKLYFLGVRRFVLIGMEELERTPYFQSVEEDDIREVVASDIAIWNAELKNRAIMYHTAHNDFEYTVLDVASAFNEVLDHGSKYGVDDNKCYNADGVSCLWWDFFHPGQAIHKAVAKMVYKALYDMQFF